jgi:DNA-binding transcriptional LysR family regulator
MELRHITSFLVLAEELHFGRSAARLQISQPSLSLQLQQLERRVGVRLVARTSHSVRLTAAGEAFRRTAGPALGQLDRAVEAARRAGPAGWPGGGRAAAHRVQHRGASPGPLLAAATLATLPVLAAYLFTTRRVTSAFMHSGIA